MSQPTYRELPGPTEVHRLMLEARRERSRVIGDALLALFRAARATLRRRRRRWRWWPLASEVLPPAPRRG